MRFSKFVASEVKDKVDAVFDDVKKKSSKGFDKAMYIIEVLSAGAPDAIASGKMKVKSEDAIRVVGSTMAGAKASLLAIKKVMDDAEGSKNTTVEKEIDMLASIMVSYTMLSIANAHDISEGNKEIARNKYEWFKERMKLSFDDFPFEAVYELLEKEELFKRIIKVKKDE